jgi:hypothetical protein
MKKLHNKIVLFYRKPYKIGHYSIEKIFNQVHASLKNEYEIKIYKQRFYSQGILNRILNCIYSSVNQGSINHITGDIHYISLLFQRKKTILTVHDCTLLDNNHGLKKFIYYIFWFKLPYYKSKYITTISGYTKDRLVEVAKFSPKRISIIPDPLSNDYIYSKKIFNVNCPIILHIGTTPNKNIAALLQSPIKKYTSKEKFNSRLSRLLMFEPNSGKSKMFAYEMNDSISGKYIDWKIGDMTAINNTQFLVLEHGKVNGKLMAEIYLIDISKASILPTNPKDKNHLIEQFIDAKTLAHKTGLIAVSKKLLLNLTDNGYQTNINKPEGITLINNQTIAIVNDNDYGIGEVDEKNTIQILDAKTHIYLFTLPEKLNFIPQY